MLSKLQLSNEKNLLSCHNDSILSLSLDHIEYRYLLSLEKIKKLVSMMWVIILLNQIH